MGGKSVCVSASQPASQPARRRTLSGSHFFYLSHVVPFNIQTDRDETCEEKELKKEKRKKELVQRTAPATLEKFGTDRKKKKTAGACNPLVTVWKCHVKEEGKEARDLKSILSVKRRHG